MTVAPNATSDNANDYHAFCPQSVDQGFYL